MDVQKPFNVLFLCTHNSGSSLIAEAVLNHPMINQGRFQAFSAGSHPSGKVSPYTYELLIKNHLPVEHLRSKDWMEFAKPDAPPLDFVFTLCDKVATETSPEWYGQPMTVHWGVPDPVEVVGVDDTKRKAFFLAWSYLYNRISLFAQLPISKLDRLTLQRRLDDIGDRIPENA